MLETQTQTETHAQNKNPTQNTNMKHKHNLKLSPKSTPKHKHKRQKQRIEAKMGQQGSAAERGLATMGLWRLGSCKSVMDLWRKKEAREEVVRREDNEMQKKE